MSIVVLRLISILFVLNYVNNGRHLKALRSPVVQRECVKELCNRGHDSVTVTVLRFSIQVLTCFIPYHVLWTSSLDD